jgi:hypothetical protein
MQALQHPFAVLQEKSVIVRRGVDDLGPQFAEAMIQGIDESSYFLFGEVDPHMGLLSTRRCDETTRAIYCHESIYQIPLQ